MNFFQRKRGILLTVAIGTFMAAMDASVVNIVLPKIGSYFHASLSTIAWTVMSYLLVISSLLLTYGRLGDMVGHKKIYLMGFWIFTIGSLLCGLSPSVLTLILFRVIQAVGAGMLMAMGPAIVTDAVTPEERGRALSISAVAVASALTIGPVLGGALTALLGWRYIFYINIPIGIIGWILAKQTISEREEHTVQPFDFVGASLVFAALIFILLPLSLVESYSWNNFWLLGAIAVGLGLAAGFVIWERHTPHPIFDISLFRNRLFAMSNVSSLLNFMAQYTIILLIPFYLEKLKGLPPEKAGLLYLPMPLATLIVAPISGTLSDRMDSRYISSAGMAIIALGMGLLSYLRADSSVYYIMVSMVTVGFGIGLFQTPNNSAIMGAVPPMKRGVASGMLATMRNIGMVVGVAVSSAVFSSSQIGQRALWYAKGLNGLRLERASFIGALHISYLVGASFAVLGIVTSLIKGSTRQDSTKSL